MIRSIAIFAVFAFATVLVIVLQPGPRPDYAFESAVPVAQDASRNEVQVMNPTAPEPALLIPDEVILDLKRQAADTPSPRPAAQPVGSLQRLQAALDASLGTVQPVSDAIPVRAAVQPTLSAAPTALRPTVAPELRDMSWQTLETLNALGHHHTSPGQEGSLLNSIVRRSMGQVETGPQVGRQQASVTTELRKQPVVRAQSATQSTYLVVPGDTLALIAIKLYGSALAKDRLLSDNPDLRRNPDALRIGQRLSYAAN